MTASAAFHFASQASGLKYSASAASPVVATLDSLAGVVSVTWTVISTDETDVVATRDATRVLSGQLNSVCTLTSGAAGSAGILRCTVFDGETSYTSTGKFHVLAANGLEVCAVNETLESHPTFGWTGPFNGAIRAAGGGQAATLVGANNVDVIKIASAGGPLATVAKLDASDNLQLGDVDDAGTVQNVDIRADSLVRIFVAGSEALGTDGSVIEFSAPSLTWATGAASPTLSQSQAVAGAGGPMLFQPQQGATGANRGGHVLLGGGPAGTSGSAKAGDTVIDLGAPETGGDTTAALVVKLGPALGTAMDLYSHDASAYAMTLTAAGALVLTTAGALTINGAPHERTTASIDSGDSPYTLTSPNATLIVNTFGGNVTVNFPTAVGVPSSCSIEVIHEVSGNDLFLEGNGAETVGGVATYDFSSPVLHWAVFRPIGGVWVRTLKELA